MPAGLQDLFPSRITIGDNVTINRECALYASYMVDNVEIKIGNNVALSPHVRIFTATHDYSTLGLDDKAASVIIEDYAWIGGGNNTSRRNNWRGSSNRCRVYRFQKCATVFCGHRQSCACDQTTGSVALTTFIKSFILLVVLRKWVLGTFPMNQILIPSMSSM